MDGRTHYDRMLAEPGNGDDDARPVVQSSGPRRPNELKPIVPPGLRRGQIKTTVGIKTRVTVHHVGYALTHRPHLFIAAVAIGLYRFVWYQLRWWWVAEQSRLRQQMANENKAKEWYVLHRSVQQTRLTRGIVLCAELLGLVIGLSVIYQSTIVVRFFFVMFAGIVFAFAGQTTKIKAAAQSVVKPAVRRLNLDVVAGAMEAAKLSFPNTEDPKKDRPCTFPKGMFRDGNGQTVIVNLPRGIGWESARQARSSIASGLDVLLTQVYVSADPAGRSHRTFELWIADDDPLAVKAGTNPLCMHPEEMDFWQPFSIGLDERGRNVMLDMFWHSVLVGAIQRWGKSTVARNIAIIAALDPYVQLSILDGSPKPDWRPFAPIAEHAVFGVVPLGGKDPRWEAARVLREIKADVIDRYERLSMDLSEIDTPEHKLTREIARDPNMNMPVRVIILEEVQEFFNTGVKQLDDQIADDLIWLIRVGPAAGVHLVTATQRPSGVGADRVKQRFTAYRDLHGIRVAGRVPDWRWSEFVLGAGTYSGGLDASVFVPGHEGSFLIHGAPDLTSPIVRAWNSTRDDIKRVVEYARLLRLEHETLRGQANGNSTRPAQFPMRDILSDVLSAMGTEAKVSWERLLSTLQRVHGEAYKAMTKEELGKAVRAAGPGIKSVKFRQGSATPWGVERVSIEQAIESRKGSE